jgi:small subunit ribosomal protein S9
MSKKEETSKYIYGVGRRKRATARAKYYPNGSSLNIIINKKPISDYFEDYFQKTILIALNNLAVTTGEFHVFVSGGGVKGQAEAIRLAMTKSLVKFDEGYRAIARMHGYLTTDPRIVAPKKTGLRKNRKREQWSKR